MENTDVKRLLKLIEDQLGWGPSDAWASRDFEELNILIQDKTKVSLSSSTLRRLWGKADYKNQPSLTTLDTLARFAGFESWKKCFRKQDENVIIKIKRVQPRLLNRYWIITTTIVIVLVCAVTAFYISGTSAPAKNNYVFYAHPITHDLPNTVVFTYDAKSASTDSVFIQQSWDATRRVKVDKNKTLFNSIYYKPGFYHAKLTVGKQVAKEHPLLIPTNGWLGLIDQNPVPVYLNKQEFITGNGIRFNVSTIADHHLALEPEAPNIEFYNTGNFAPVPITDFSFSTEVRNNYKSGSSRCQQIDVILYTNDIPISIPLSEPGCVATLKLLDGHQAFKGDDNDLTGFGVDPSNWVKVKMISRTGKISITVNGKKVFEISVSNHSTEILGLGFIFKGSAEIRNVYLTSGNLVKFKDFY